MISEKELIEGYRTYVTNCLEDERFDLATMEDWETWKEEELERLKSKNKSDTIVCSKERLERSFRAAHCDGKHGFDIDIKSYMVNLE